MNKIKLLALFFIATLLTGCATYKPVPEGFTGPVATIIDTGRTEDFSKAQIFYVAEVDGHTIDNARSVSRQASYNTGMALNMRTTERKVPVKPMKLKLVASHVVAAPIHELSSRAIGTFFEVEGVVDFTPKADASYVVKGELKKKASSVWLEEVGSGQVVTEKIVEK